MNFREFWRAFSLNKGAVAGLLFMAVVVLLALFAPLVAPHSPIEQDRDHFLQAPSGPAAARSSCWAPTSSAATCSRG